MTKAKKYTQILPSEVEAVQCDGHNFDLIREWMSDGDRTRANPANLLITEPSDSGAHSSAAGYTAYLYEDATKEIWQRVARYDWVVKTKVGVFPKFIRMSDSEFKSKYVPK